MTHHCCIVCSLRCGVLGQVEFTSEKEVIFCMQSMMFSSVHWCLFIFCSKNYGNAIWKKKMGCSGPISLIHDASPGGCCSSYFLQCKIVSILILLLSSDYAFPQPCSRPSSPHTYNVHVYTDTHAACPPSFPVPPSIKASMCVVRHTPSSSTHVTRNPCFSQKAIAPGRKGCVCKYKRAIPSCAADRLTARTSADASPHRRYRGTTNRRTSSTVQRPSWS